ncbi:MAG TPA: ribonucleotide-diphosphate reductase subunit beta [Gaiellaceae bacterium]|jgi:ribonucleoside-diphosphate reductase beta chain
MGEDERAAAAIVPDGVEGDPATIDDARLAELRLLGPRRLYLLWESRHWASTALDFEQDRRDWEDFPEAGRQLLIDSLAPIFAGEERVAALFPPIIMAAESEPEAAFLSTQQVDEARHTHFFDRFWREVFLPDADESEAAVADARARCNDAFTELFDRRLNAAVDRLRLDPSDLEAKVEAVTIYHLIVEGMLGLTSLNFCLRYLRSNDILPGIAEGFANVKRDEHRHVAWGTFFLRAKCQESDHYGAIVQDTLVELLPVAASVAVEGGQGLCDGLDACEFLGFPSAELNRYALRALARRLKVIGGATEEVQQFAEASASRAEMAL